MRKNKKIIYLWCLLTLLQLSYSNVAISIVNAAETATTVTKDSHEKGTVSTISDNKEIPPMSVISTSTTMPNETSTTTSSSTDHADVTKSDSNERNIHKTVEQETNQKLPISDTTIRPVASNGKLDIELVNGNFENPKISEQGQYTPEKDVPGWKTTATDKIIELWEKGIDPTQPIKWYSPGEGGAPCEWRKVDAYRGNQFAELNATQASALYQDIPTTPGETVYWQVAHSGRKGKDTALVEFGAPNQALSPIQEMNDSRLTWRSYSGFYKVPAGQTITRFQFRAISAKGGKAYGNFLDNVIFTNIQSNIIVHYVDEDGNKIHEDQSVKGYKGADYDVSGEPYVLAIPGYSLNKDKLPKNLKGTYTDTDQEVTFIYNSNPKKRITMSYLDEADNKIHEDQVVEANEGSYFDVNDERYKLAIPTYNFSSADYVKSEQSDKIKVAENNLITYRYVRKKQGTVTVRYLDSRNNEIHERKYFKDYIDSSYNVGTTEYQVGIHGYQLDQDAIPANIRGNIQESNINVDYHYKKGTTLHFHYIDENGKNIAATKNLQGIEGDDYDGNSYIETIDNYQLDENKMPKNITGKFGYDDIDITFVYKHKKGYLYLRYLDSKNKMIYKSQQIIGDLESDYDLSGKEYQPDITGYQLDKANLPSNIKGRFKKSLTTIDFRYKKLSQLVLHFVDDKGSVLESNEYIKGVEGDNYDVSSSVKKIKEYKLDHIENEKGTFGYDDQEVTFVYKKIIHPSLYIEVPKLVRLYKSSQDVLGQGKIAYHSVKGEEDQTVELKTDQKVILNNDSTRERVPIDVFHTDDSPVDDFLCKLSKEDNKYIFHLKGKADDFKQLGKTYEGRMIYKLKVKE